MSEPILPDLPAGFYLSLIDGGFPKVYKRHADGWNDDQGDDCADPRSEWYGLTLHSIPALLSAASERDALAICLHDEKTERARESRESVAIRRGMEAENYLLKERRTELSERAEKAEKERDALKVDLAEALSVLTELSSHYSNEYGMGVCAFCESGIGHKPDCALAAVLAKAKS